MNTHIEEERKVTREVREQLGLTDRRCNAMAGELEESKALLEAAIRYIDQSDLNLIIKLNMHWNVCQIKVWVGSWKMILKWAP